MFFKKSREAKKQAAEQAQVEAIKGVQQQLDDALVLPDKAERLMKVAEISASLHTLEWEKRNALRKSASNKMYAPYLGMTGTTLATTTVVVTCLHFPPALLMLAFPSIFGGLWAGAARSGRAQKRMLEENKTFFDGLAAIKIDADNAAETIMRDNLKELAESPKISAALDAVPKLREHFSQAFVLKTVETSAPAQEPPKPAGKSGLSL